MELMTIDGKDWMWSKASYKKSVHAFPFSLAKTGHTSACGDRMAPDRRNWRYSERCKSCMKKLGITA